MPKKENNFSRLVSPSRNFRLDLKSKRSFTKVSSKLNFSLANSAAVIANGCPLSPVKKEPSSPSNRPNPLRLDTLAWVFILAVFSRYSKTSP